jgi:hypothetical protein
MNQIILKQNGIILFKNKVVKESPLHFLSCQVTLSERYTLRSFFMMLESYPILSELNPFSVSFMKQFVSFRETSCKCEGVDRIELGRTIEMKGFPGKPSLDVYNTFYGISNNEPLDIKTLWLQDFLDIELSLGKLRHIIFGDRMDILEFDTIYNLFEFIDGISWGLSFHTLPSKCDIRSSGKK